MKALIIVLAAFFWCATASAHPSSSASVLDHNIVAIELSVAVNIPPNSASGIIVRQGHSLCRMVPVKAEDFDRSFSKVEGGRVVPVTLRLFGKPTVWEKRVWKEGVQDGIDDTYKVWDDYVEFPLASEADPSQPNPNVKSIICGYSEKGFVPYPGIHPINRVYRTYQIPSMDQLSSFTEGALRFIPGPTVELQGQ